MTGFSGNLEETAYNLLNFNEARLLRLQQVRQQEKLISSSRCNAYRKLIDDRKNIKKTSLKENLISQRKIQHDDLAIAWQKALVDTGDAHRTAAQVTQTKEVFNEDEWRLEKERQIVSIQRGRDAASLRNYKNIIEEQVAADRLERGSLRKSAIASDREDARATAEAKVAKTAQFILRQKHLASQTIDLQRTSNIVKLTRQSALSIQDRGSAVAGTQVVRHGKLNNDKSLIVNNSDDAEKYALQKQWNTVMKEMLHRKIIGSRAFFARKTIAMKQQAGRLEAELLMLSLADKAACRASKARNVASVKRFPQDMGSNISALNAFEAEFSSNAEKSISPTFSDSLNTAPSSSLKPNDDDMTTEIDTGLLESMSSRPRQPLMWEVEKTPQNSRLKAVSTNRAASLDQLDSQRPLFTSIAGRRSMALSIDKSSPLLWTTPLESEEPNIRHSSEDSVKPKAYGHPSPLSLSDSSNRNSVQRHSLVIDVPDISTKSSHPSEEDSLFDSIRSEDVGQFSRDARTSRRQVLRGGVETDLSSSTAATLEARHDQYSHPISSRQELQQTSFPLNEMSKRKVHQYLEEDSSVRDEDSSVRVSGHGSSSNSSSSSMTEHPVGDLSYSQMRSNQEDQDSEDQEDRKSFALTVRMQRTRAGGEHDSESSRGSNDASIDSFEAFFEDESEEGDLYPEKSRVLTTKDIRAIHDESGSSESLPTSHGDRDLDGDDNMSAITWPEMASRKEAAPSPQANDIHSKYLMRNEAAGKGQWRGGTAAESDPDSLDLDVGSYDRLRESDSIDEDGLLQELDELSISWARRKKNLEEKGRYS